MKIKNRQRRIIELLLREKQVRVEDLARRFAVSRETVRRDLGELANRGKVQKVHGGAVLPRVFAEGPFQQRMGENAASKMRMARRAAGLFQAGETLFIDTGSTTLYLAQALGLVSGLTIVTNSSAIAEAVSSAEAEIRVFLLGGEFSADNRQTVGGMVIEQIRTFRAHHAVLTIGALDGQSGAMNYNIEEAQVARAMIGQSRSLTVLADHSKFGALAAFEVCPLSRIDYLVCDTAPSGSLRRDLDAAGVEVVVAQEE